MSTPYDECYDSFLSTVYDTDILYPLEGESESEFLDRIELLCFTLLKKAVSILGRKSRTSLQMNDTNKCFINTLRQTEIHILGFLMLREYYRKQLNFLVGLKHSFSDKDWKSHDKGNQMNQYRQLIKELNTEIDNLIIQNSFTSESGQFEIWEDTI